MTFEPTLRLIRCEAAIRRHDTAAVFDWLMAALSYQGIADQVAYDYMEKHGRAAWRDIDQKLGRGVSCPKLKSYWHFHGCRYEKASRTCAEPDHIGACPLPSHDLRNGHLNQTAYSLFLFIRDLADGDLIGWIDAQLAGRRRSAWPAPVKPNGGGPDRADAGDLRGLGQGPRHGPVQPAARRSQEAGPLDRGRRQADRHRHVGAQLSAPDRHPGPVQREPLCMARPATGPAAVPTLLQPWRSGSTPGSSIRPFRRTFPRFVQHAIWRYCSQSGLDVCNGNRIDDAKRCGNLDCRVRAMCDRVALRKAIEI